MSQGAKVRLPVLGGVWSRMSQGAKVILFTVMTWMSQQEVCKIDKIS